MNEITKQKIVATASRLIAKYPDGYLSEPELIRWEGWAVAIRGPDVDGLDTPKAIIRGSYMEIRAFEIAYRRAKKKLSLDGGWQDRYGGLEWLPSTFAKSYCSIRGFVSIIIAFEY